MAEITPARLPRSLNVVGNRKLTHLLARVAGTAVLCAAMAAPLHDAAVASDSGPLAAPVPVRADPGMDRVTQPAPKGFTDDAAKVSFDPPVGWLRGPATALNAQSEPPDPAHELVRYQLRIGDASLYALPVPITSALIRDAGAIITVGLARAGGDMLGLDVDPRSDRADALPVAGFFQIDEERVYEGLHVFTRYFIARETDRRLIARAVMPEEEWAALEPLVRASFDSLRADPKGPNAPAAPPPAPVVEQPAVTAAVVIADPSIGIRQSIIDRAASMLATPYVWGGNAPGRGMDCSAYVSMAWGVARYTTESIGWVSSPISKEDLRAGDAMNLTMSRDPQGYGHIRMFEAWANEAHTLVWVYEETPPRAVHRVVVYDDRYQPIRLDGLSNAGSAALVPAPAPAPEQAFVPSSEGGSRNRATPRPYTPRPYTPRTPTPRPLVVPSGVPQLYAPGSRPIVTATPRPTPRPTVRPTVRPTATPHR